MKNAWRKFITTYVVTPLVGGYKAFVQLRRALFWTLVVVASVSVGAWAWDINWFQTHEFAAIWLEGIALLAIFIWDRFDARAQHSEMVVQLKALGEQTEATQKVAEAAIRSAKAAEASSEIANKNIETFISKERARLRVEMKPLNLSTPTAKTAYTVDFTVSIYGSTPAFIVEANCGAYDWPQDAIDDPELMNMAMVPMYSLPKTISPNTPPVETFAFLLFDAELRDLSEIKTDRLFVVIRGFIKYRDVFDRDLETRFRYVWKFSPYSSQDEPDRFGAWEKCGPPEDNAET